MGQIVRPHGVRGEVLVDSHSDNPGRFATGSKLLMGETHPLVLTVASSRPRSQTKLVVGFEEISDRNEAERCRGALLFIDPSEAVPAEEGSYWARDLIGLEVFDLSGRSLGKISDVYSRPLQDLWEVAHPSGPVLLPAVEPVIREIDISSGRVVVDPPEGLFGEES